MLTTTDMKRFEVIFSPAGLRELATALEALDGDWKVDYLSRESNQLKVEFIKKSV